MNGSIRQRIYGLALLPLALLAMALLVFNGLARVEQARSELRGSQKMIVELLQERAAEALVLGNILAFDEVTDELLRNSTAIACIVLRDEEERVVSRHGDCGETTLADRFAIRTAGDGLSDFDVTPQVTLGHMTILMNDARVRQQRQHIVIQIAFSLILILIVLGIMQRLLRSRLIEPIEQIHLGMNALRKDAYQTRISVQGDDELARLAHSINATIDRIAAYTRELERRRDEANRALQEADDEGLARDALVGWLAEDLEGPLHAMQGELTSVAVSNNDPRLRGGIRHALALLQDARASLGELMQVAAMHRLRPSPPSYLKDLWLDLQQDIRQYTEANDARVTLMVSGQEITGDFPLSEVFADVDSGRLRKALLYLVQAMDRRCIDRVVEVNAQFIAVAEDQLHIVFTLKALFEPMQDSVATGWAKRLSEGALRRVPPGHLRWSDREARVVDYLLRSIRVAPTYTVSEQGSVSIVIELTCRFARTRSPSNVAESAEPSHRPVVAGVVTDDLTLGRLMIRGDLSRVEFRIVSMSEALAEPSKLKGHSVLLVDICDDVSDAFALVDRLQVQAAKLPLIAISPPGRVSADLSSRMFDAGFTGIVQKPVQYGRMIGVIDDALRVAQGARLFDS